MNIEEHVNKLQADAMQLRLTVERLAHGVDHNTVESRAAATLYKRARRVARAFLTRARGHQTRAMNRSRKLAEYRTAWLDLERRREDLVWRSRGQYGKALQGVKVDLRSIKRTMDQWATEGQAEKGAGDAE